MQKSAQKRSVLNKLREMSNVSGIAAEKFFNPQFQEVMENLRAIDAGIRAIATGQQIEGADPDPSNTGDTSSLKTLLKSAKTNLNRREYMTAVAELGRFHKKLADIVGLVGKLHNKINEVHHQFLFQDLDEEHKNQLQALKTRFAQEQAALVKEASIMDFFYNIGTKRGRALAFYEKRYPKEVGKLKKDTANLLNKSETLLAQLIASLKEMAGARAIRNVDAYMNAAAKITRGYGSYNELFKDYYNSNVRGFLEKIELVSPTEKVESKGLGQQEISVEKAPTEAPTAVRVPVHQEAEPLAPTQTPSQPPAPVDLVNPKFPGTPRLPTNVGPSVPITPPPDTEKMLKLPEMETTKPESEIPNIYPRYTPHGTRISHAGFWESLQSLSNEDPVILGAYINKYAQSIQQQDPQVAVKLFQISRSIKG